jgi:hypothetical protein
MCDHIVFAPDMLAQRSTQLVTTIVGVDIIFLSQDDNSVDHTTCKVVHSLTLLKTNIVNSGIAATIAAEALQLVRLPRTNSADIPIW